MKGCQCVGGILSIGLACMNAHLGLACRYIAATRKLYGKDDPTPFDMYQVDMLADGMCCTPSVCVRECVRVCVCVCVCVCEAYLEKGFRFDCALLVHKQGPETFTSGLFRCLSCQTQTTSSKAT